MAAAEAASEDPYVLSRNVAATVRQVSRPLSGLFREGADNNGRLNLQHYIWKEESGYLLHPSIPTDQENLSVADVGTGTGYGVHFLQVSANSAGTENSWLLISRPVYGCLILPRSFRLQHDWKA